VITFSAQTLAQPGDPTPSVSDEQLLAEVLDALPAGVTFETATGPQLEAAVNSVISSRSATPGSIAADIVTQVLSAVTVTLDSVGRSAVSNNVSGNVINSQDPAAQAQMTTTVLQSRQNPTPTQIAATGSYLAGLLPSTRQQQNTQQPTGGQNQTLVQNPTLNNLNTLGAPGAGGNAFGGGTPQRVGNFGSSGGTGGGIGSTVNNLINNPGQGGGGPLPPIVRSNNPVVIIPPTQVDGGHPI
jgi:hypothetical protein